MPREKVKDKKTKKEEVVKKKGRKKEAEESVSEKREAGVLSLLMPYLIGTVALFFAMCFLLGEEKLGYLGWVSVFLRGLFSGGAYFVPVLLLVHAVFYKRDLGVGSHVYKFWFSLADLIFLGAFVAMVQGAEPVFDLRINYLAGVTLSGGGALGGLLFASLSHTVGMFTPVLLSLGVILFSSFVVGATPASLIRSLVLAATGRRRRAREERLLRRAEEKRRLEEEKAAEEEKWRLARERAAVEEEKFRTDVKKMKREAKLRSAWESDEEAYQEPVEDRVPDGEEDIRLPLAEEKARRAAMEAEERARARREVQSIQDIPTEPAPDLRPTADSHEDILDLFRHKPEETAVPTIPLCADDQASETTLYGEEPSEVPPAEPLYEEEEAAVPEYVFPPISLLQMPQAPHAASRSEQDATAKKLVETLASFGVKTSICGISKGPAVTRYELQPQPGVRVRSIVNLTDDIALSLASGGVRIEAPIPGKEAVGIEVPNRQRDIVPVRELIEKEEFQKNHSRLNCCLGQDVAGKSVFCDLSKMPHILIAGATGMGKSVCLNSLLVSILYHATPDEVKLILIDPKKVEMSSYNRIPHLIVPVVSDSKKAAATLSWAVLEMEKRFIEMEEVGVRDIKDYNKLTARDPEKQPIPQIVIVIDELADLMMVARDEVETSICRLAQKARAAGMHLVIGTQRPSVDVITGLIKSNIPSRIACTVASQVDSRTIIDIQGAEKLMGKGDMLYAPVGAMKPLRVQGCFVSNDEIESICDFIRNQREAQYDESVSNLIEREASRVGEKKKSGAEEYSDGEMGLFADKDPLLEKAIDVAVSEKKVATSLLQRRLSVGYARAAKLIDYMEEMNVVGPYAGSKPREVLWTPETLMEYKARAKQPIE